MSQSKILPSEVGLSNVKFDTALILSKARFFQDNLVDDNIIHHLNLYSSIKKAKISVSNNILFTDILLHQTEFLSSVLLRHLKISHESLILQEDHLLQNSTPKMKEKHYSNALEKYREIINIPIIIKSFTTGAEEFTKIINHCRKYRYINRWMKLLPSDQLLNMIKYQSKIFKCTIIPIFGNVLVLDGNESFLFSMDQFTLCYNKVLEIRNVLLTAWFFNGRVWSKSIFYECVSILKFMVLQVRYLDNKAYSIFKNFDGIGSALILMKESKFDNSDPINDITGELISDRLLTANQSKYLLKLLDGPPEEILEKTALSKLAGHPEIETYLGVDKLRKRTFSNNSVSHEDVSNLICSMKKNFIRQFLLRHSRWPHVEFKPSVNKTLVYCNFNSIWIHDSRIPNDYPPVKLSDFNDLDISKIKDFDMVESQFPILKDTALAATRSIIEDPFFSKIRDVRLTRTLLYFLLTNHPHINVQKYMKELNEYNPLCLEYLVIKLTQKERELKNEGRFFGQSPYEERARRCILEHNVSKLMTLYNSSQGMTLNELQKFQKLYVLSQFQREKPEYYTIYISVDVEAFNNNFRREVCEPVGREFFNRIFGVPWYSNIMDTFEYSLFSFSDGLMDFKWEGQYGGIEGLFQKFWTWIYESVASRVAEMTSYNHFIMVNGDDLRVVLLIPKSEVKDEIECKKLFTEIANSFHMNYNKFGFKMKINETYFSSEYIGFGKLYLYQSRFCSLTLKKVAKTHGLANLMGDYPLEYIKGVMSETLSTMSYSVNHRYLYLIGLIQVLEYIFQFYPDSSQLSNRELVILLLWPSNFGGLPILPYIRCLYKGDSDVETIWLSVLVFLHREYPEIGDPLIDLWFQFITKSQDYQGLALNPYSIPNSTPPEGITLIKNFIRKKLPVICRNSNFLKVLIKADPFKVYKYIRAIFDCNPVPAKALSVIYSTSAAGQIDEFIEKFTTSKSIGGFLTKNFKSINSIRILRKAKQFDLNKIQFCTKAVINRTRTNNPIALSIRRGNYNHCPTKLGDDLRSWAYGKPIVGVTYPCIVDQISIHDLSNPVNPSDLDYLTFWRSPIPTQISSNYTHGPHKIYLGNHTHLKLISPDIEIKASSPGMARVNKLLKIYSMMKNLGPDCINFVKKNLFDLTGLDPELLVLICHEHTSGSITHRVPTNHWSPLVAPNELSNRSSYIKSTTRSDHQSKSRTGDQTINYGLIRAHVNLMIMYNSEFESFGGFEQQEVYWARISSCPTCTFEVTDVQIKWHSSVPDINFSISNNPYVSLSSSDMEILVKSIHKFSQSKSYQTYTECKKDDPQLVKFCRRLMAFNLFNFCNDPLRTYHQDNNLLDCEEEEISSLMLVSSLDLVNLSDLKSLPCDYFLSALFDYLYNWITERYLWDLGSGDFLHILNEHSCKLPLKTVCSMLIESGVWPVLRNFLIDNHYTKVPLPPDNVDSIFSLQSYLIKLSVMELLNLKTSTKIFEETQILPICKLPDDNQLTRLVQNGIQQLTIKYVIHWLYSPMGAMFRNSVIDNQFNQVKRNLFELSRIGMNTLPESYMKEFSVFCLINDPEKSILRIVLALCGLNESIVDEEIIPRLIGLTDIPTGEIINLFIMSTVQVVILPTDEVTHIVREQGNALFKQFYDKKKAHQKLERQTIIQPSPSTSSSEILIPDSPKFHGKIDLKYTLEPADYDFHIYNHRLDELWNTLKETSFEFIPNINNIIGQIGGVTGKLFPELITLNSILPKTHASDKILCINDYQGTFTACMLFLSESFRVINMSCDFIDQSKNVPLSDINPYFLRFSGRLDISPTMGHIGNITNADHLDYIKKTYSQKFEGILLNYNKTFIHSVCNNKFIQLVHDLADLVQARGFLLLKIKLHQLSVNPLKFLAEIKKAFSQITWYRSTIKFNGFPTFYWLFQYPKKENNQMVITTHGLLAFQRSYAMNTEKTTKKIKRSNIIPDTIHKTIVKWYSRLGMRDLIQLSDVLQTISLGAMIQLNERTYESFSEKFSKYLSSELSRLEARIRFIAPDLENCSVTPDIRHQMRIYFESLTLLQLINNVNFHLDYLLEDPSTHIQLIAKQSENGACEHLSLTTVDNLIRIVGHDWKLLEFRVFQMKSIELLIWCLLKYSYDVK